MGLDLLVGALSRATLTGDTDYADHLSEHFDNLNRVLRKANHPSHLEPSDIPEDAYFEAQMWGYNGLHFVRRLAAYDASLRQLPPAWDNTGADDPVVTQFYERYRHYGRAGGWRPFGWGTRATRPPYAHLMWHSDAEGFYLPRAFDDVVFDRSNPSIEGVGAMVGSSVRLLDECMCLAKLIDLPETLHPEDEALWRVAEAPPATGLLWQVYGREAFGLVRLIAACRLSVSHGAALVFT